MVADGDVGVTPPFDAEDADEPAVAVFDPDGTGVVDVAWIAIVVVVVPFAATSPGVSTPSATMFVVAPFSVASSATECVSSGDFADG